MGQIRIDGNSGYRNNMITIYLLLLSIRKGENDMAGTFRDPVCGMEVTYETAQARSEYEGQTYYFDSIECKETFDKEPEKYIAQEQETPR
jgi:YHS domain-containing protein